MLRIYLIKERPNLFSCSFLFSGKNQHTKIGCLNTTVFEMVLTRKLPKQYNIIFDTERDRRRQKAKTVSFSLHT